MSQTFQIKNLSINFDDLSIKYHGAEIKIDQKAVAVLKLLIENAGNTVQNKHFMEVVWHNKPSSIEVISAAIARLRKVFKKTDIDANMIVTIHKIGYRLDLPSTKKEKTSLSNKTQSKSFSALLVLLCIASLASLAIVFKQYLDDNKTINKNQTGQPTISKESESGFTQIYILRHADKVDDSENSPLSEIGIQRAKYWKTVLQYIKFDTVYTTDFKRNKQTASLISEDKIPIEIYYPMSFDVKKFISKVRGKKILIIAHSNTIPDMVNRLIGESTYAPMSHRNYSMLFIITISDEGKSTSSLLHIEKP